MHTICWGGRMNRGSRATRKRPPLPCTGGCTRDRACATCTLAACSARQSLGAGRVADKMFRAASDLEIRCTCAACAHIRSQMRCCAHCRTASVGGEHNMRKRSHRYIHPSRRVAGRQHVRRGRIDARTSPHSAVGGCAQGASCRLNRRPPAMLCRSGSDTLSAPAR